MNINNINVISYYEEPNFEISTAEKNLEKPSGLIRVLKELAAKSSSKKTKIGIIQDIDKTNIADRISQVNTAIKEAISQYVKEKTLGNPTLNIPDIKNAGEFISVIFPSEHGGYSSFECACHFVGIKATDGSITGEIEDILKKIKSKDSYFADCMERCIKNDCNGSNVDGRLFLSDKELVKLWVDNYVRIDTLNGKGRKCKSVPRQYLILIIS
jgi:hypothetical protein